MFASADGDVADYPWERPLGAGPLPGGGVEFRVWAPHAESIALRIRGHDLPLDDAGYGVYETSTDARPGDDYVFVVDGRELPDPCSRWQPDGIRGPSCIVEAPERRGLHPTNAARARDLRITYWGLHAQGTFDAAIEHLPG